MISAKEEEERVDGNPATLHALYLLDDCKDDVEQARSLSRMQIQSNQKCDRKHWLQVYAVLNREGKGKC